MTVQLPGNQVAPFPIDPEQGLDLINRINRFAGCQAVSGASEAELLRGIPGLLQLYIDSHSYLDSPQVKATAVEQVERMKLSLQGKGDLAVAMARSAAIGKKVTPAQVNATKTSGVPRLIAKGLIEKAEGQA